LQYPSPHAALVSALALSTVAAILSRASADAPSFIQSALPASLAPVSASKMSLVITPSLQPAALLRCLKNPGLKPFA